MTDLLATAGFIALGFFFGWQCRDHAQLEKEWRARDAQSQPNTEMTNAKSEAPSKEQS